MTYSIVNSKNDLIGRYTGDIPIRAAKKASKEIYKNTGKTRFKVTLHDNETGKLYYYEANIQEYDTPKRIKIGNSIFEEKYNIHLIKLG